MRNINTYLLRFFGFLLLKSWRGFEKLLKIVVEISAWSTVKLVSILIPCVALVLAIATVSHGYQLFEETLIRKASATYIRGVNYVALNHGYRLPTIPLTRNEIVVKESRVNGINADLTRCVIHVESKNDKMAESRARARGLMQIMPEHKNFCGFKDEADFFDPELNIACGTRLLKEELDATNGDLRLALMRYNAGPKRVGKTEENLQYPRLILACLAKKMGEQ